MLRYVSHDLQGQGQAAIDVLRSGLSMLPPGAPAETGYDSGRLHMALSEAFAAEHDWAQSAAAAAAASAAFSHAPPSASALAGVASLQACRSLLAGSRDEEAASAGAASIPTLAQHSRQLLVAHATSAPAAGAAAAPAAVVEGLAALRAALDQEQQQPSRGAAGGLLLAVGHKLAADAALAQGDAEAASASYAAAKHACDDSSCSSESGVSSRLQQEVAADVLMGQAQVLMAHKQWDQAEEVLGQALKAAEAAAAPGAASSSGSSSSNALLAPVLLLLATGYCRSARVLLAEGLLREAAKMLGGSSDPHRLLEGASTHASLTHQPCHPSLKAAVCWRYSQLLTALPNRSAEAAAWGAAAQKLLSDCGGQGFAGLPIEQVLGDAAALKGQGQHGSGAIVSLLARRLLPVYC